MRQTTPINFAGHELRDFRHVCAFFNSEEEEYSVLLPFVRDGFVGGDKAIHILNPGQCEYHLERLGAAGIDTEAAERRGQLEIRTNIDVYLRNGHFDANLMLEAFEQLAGGDGWPLSRIVCRMDWAGRGHPQVEDLIEFESRVNEVWLRHNDVVICSYQLDQFGGETVVDIMRTHPMIIIGGVLQYNPFFVPPERFLLELHERRSKRGLSTASI